MEVGVTPSVSPAWETVVVVTLAQPANTDAATAPTATGTRIAGPHRRRPPLGARRSPDCAPPPSVHSSPLACSHRRHGRRLPAAVRTYRLGSRCRSTVTVAPWPSPGIPGRRRVRATDRGAVRRRCSEAAGHDGGGLPDHLLLAVDVVEPDVEVDQVVVALGPCPGDHDPRAQLLVGPGLPGEPHLEPPYVAHSHVVGDGRSEEAHGEHQIGRAHV